MIVLVYFALHCISFLFFWLYAHFASHDISYIYFGTGVNTELLFFPTPRIYA